MIAFCTTCKGRTLHVRQTLPRNLKDNRQEGNKFVLLNYGSRDGLIEFVQSSLASEIESGKLVVYSFYTTRPFHVAHAKNMAARLGMMEGGDKLVTLDADNFTGADFDQFVAENLDQPGVFLSPDHFTIRRSSARPQRGYAGRLAIRSQDFVKAGAYNEAYDTWRGEDIDLIFRMRRMDYREKAIDPRFLETIPHSADVRFKEYPHARQFENDAEWKLANDRIDTVANFGNFGNGVVFKNFSREPLSLLPVPTRVFGIGLHKTATSSLHRAFEILGFDSFHWGTGESPLIWDEVNTAGRSKSLERWYSLCDLPIPLLYQKLDKAYPGSKFILTVRDEGPWVRSVERLWDRRFNPTRWEWDVYPFSHRIHTALYGQKHFNAEVMLARYRRHNAEVKEYFKNRPGDLLVLDVSAGHGWGELCGFLGQPIPSVPFPFENPTREAVRAINSR